ncbi:MAG: hypothetical protein WBA89_24825 [Microcoleus sp.]|uniref:hypothetical protein n=1 Tax=Microcoleus sp. TaxID=44472 RepID=UPI003C71F63F
MVVVLCFVYPWLFDRTAKIHELGGETAFGDFKNIPVGRSPVPKKSSYRSSDADRPETGKNYISHSVEKVKKI